MEIWDIYDSNKQRTGRTMVREQWNMQPGEYHLTVLALLRHPSGRYLITQRDMRKSWAPGHWEIPGGGVQAGESSLQAVLREIREETGLSVTAEQGNIVWTYQRENPQEGDNYFVDVWEFVVDFQKEQIQLQEGETMNYHLADADEIASLGEQGLFLHYQSIRPVFQQ